MKTIKFELSEVESQRALDWMEEHSKVCPVSFEKGNLPAAGEHYYYRILPTGLGCCVSIGCIYCKDAHKDITDFDNW